MIQAALLQVVPEFLHAFVVPVLDVRIVLLTVVIATVSAACAAIAPGVQGRRADVRASLQAEGGRSLTRLRAGAALLATEVTLGVVLVSGAAMTVRSFLGLALKDPGFVSADVFELSVNHGWEPTARDAWFEGADRLPRVRGILSALEATPGVASAGIVSRPVLDAYGTEDDFWEERGHDGNAPPTWPRAHRN